MPGSVLRGPQPRCIRTTQRHGRCVSAHGCGHAGEISPLKSFSVGERQRLRTNRLVLVWPAAIVNIAQVDWVGERRNLLTAKDPSQSLPLSTGTVKTNVIRAKPSEVRRW